MEQFSKGSLIDVSYCLSLSWLGCTWAWTLHLSFQLSRSLLALDWIQSLYHIHVDHELPSKYQEIVLCYQFWKENKLLRIKTKVEYQNHDCEEANGWLHAQYCQRMLIASLGLCTIGIHRNHLDQRKVSAYQTLELTQFTLILICKWCLLAEELPPQAQLVYK